MADKLNNNSNYAAKNYNNSASDGDRSSLPSCFGPLPTITVVRLNKDKELIGHGLIGDTFRMIVDYGAPNFINPSVALSLGQMRSFLKSLEPKNPVRPNMDENNKQSPNLGPKPQGPT